MPLSFARRFPAKRGATTPLVVFLHGRGADERDLLELAPVFPKSYAFLSVRGGHELPEGGYRWFEDRGVGRPIAASLRTAVDDVRAVLDSAAAEFAPKNTYLFGFSQGTMVAAAMLLDEPERYAGGVLLSGAAALDAGFPATPGRLADIAVFTGHGAYDRAIPAELVAATLRYLRTSGADLSEHTYARDHAIARDEIADIVAWFAQR